jgi:hypothetical protein
VENEFDPVGLLRTLTDHGVRFVVIGGYGARLHGAPLLTEDVDVTPDSNTDNLDRLAAALMDLGARLRVPNDPVGVAFPIDPVMLATARSWTLTTRLGDLDLVFEPAGTSGFPDVITEATQETVSDSPPLVVAVASLNDIIRMKQASGRQKDQATLPLLRRTLEEIRRQEGR